MGGPGLPVDERQRTGATRRLHPLTPLVRVLDGGVQAAVAIVAALTANPALLLVFAIGGAANYVQYRRFTWTFDGVTLEVHEGVFTRKHRSLSIDRIQQVDLHQNPVHRLFGTTRVLVESAGGVAGADIALNMLGSDEARALRDAINAAKRAGGVAGPPAGEPVAGDEDQATVIVDGIPYGELALAGITGPEMLVGLAVWGAAVQLVGERLGEVVDELALGWAMWVAVGLGALVLWLASAATTSIIANGDFRMLLTDDDVHVRRGLIGRREEATPRRRVQLVEARQNPLRLLLRRASVRVVAAGTPGDQSRDRLTVPVVRQAAARDLIIAALGGATEAGGDDSTARELSSLLAPGQLVPAPLRARRRWVFRGVAPTVLVAAACTSAAVALDAPVLHLGWALVPVGVAYGVAAHRALGHRLTGGYLVTRHGVLVRRLAVVPLAKCQSARVRSSPFQRRLGLATLHIDVAGGAEPPKVLDQDSEVLESLVERLAGGAIRDRRPAAAPPLPPSAAAPG